MRVSFAYRILPGHFSLQNRRTILSMVHHELSLFRVFVGLLLLFPMGSQARNVSGSAVRITCEEAIPLTAAEQQKLFKDLQNTQVGKNLISEFKGRYGSLKALVLQWDQVSYSQILQPAETASVVCIHLAQKLPEIEHLADLAHEMTHATRLEPEVLLGYGMKSVEEFVEKRLAGAGGEADAFSVECQVKKEVLGRWDHFCAPYVDAQNFFEVSKVVEDLYNGSLSASLTGEAYPVMLSKQFQSLTRSPASVAPRPKNLKRTGNGI